MSRGAVLAIVATHFTVVGLVAGLLFCYLWPRRASASHGDLVWSLCLAQGQGATGASYCLDPSSMYLPQLPSVAQAKALRRRQEEESNAIRLINFLFTCVKAIQAGDYAAASANLADARSALATTVPTAHGIGRVASHFAAALTQRLFPSSPGHSVGAASSAAEHTGELYRQFYEAGPYLKFAHFTANHAILDAFEGCDRLHIIDLGITQGVQWPTLIKTISLRPGAPPSLRITAVGSRDELHEVGARLAEFARVVNVPFSFHVVPGDTLDTLQPWMFQITPGEALAVNSICQLHRLLVDPDSASTSLPSPIDAVLGWVAAMQPKV